MLLHEYFQTAEVRQVFASLESPNSRMIYTHSVTLWLLVLQRLAGGKTLDEVVTHVVRWLGFCGHANL